MGKNTRNEEFTSSLDWMIVWNDMWLETFMQTATGCSDTGGSMGLALTTFASFECWHGIAWLCAKHGDICTASSLGKSTLNQPLPQANAEGLSTVSVKITSKTIPKGSNSLILADSGHIYNPSISLHPLPSIGLPRQVPGHVGQVFDGLEWKASSDPETGRVLTIQNQGEARSEVHDIKQERWKQETWRSWRCKPGVFRTTMPRMKDTKAFLSWFLTT